MHFTDIDKEVDKSVKIRGDSDLHDVAYSEFYNPFEHLTTDQVTVLFQRKAAFKLCAQKKHKQIGIKIYNLCDTYGYTYDMGFYLQTDRQTENKATTDTTTTLATVKQQTRRVQGRACKLYMDN